MLVTDAFGGRGGIAKFGRDLLNVLCERDDVHQVTALPRIVSDPVGVLPDKLRFRLEGAAGKVAFLRAAARSGLRGDYDIVVCGHLNLLPVASVLAALRRAPLIVVVYGVEAWRSRTFLVRRLLKRATVVVSISEFTRGRFLEWSGVDPARVAVIPCSLDRRGYGPGPKRADLLSKYNLTGRKVLLTVARLTVADRYKGIDEVLESLPALVREIPEIAYLVVGEGDDRLRMIEKARALGIDDRVVFAGYVPESEKVDHFRLADAFVMPGRGEGFGFVYLEALACGISVIASALDASREAVRDGLLGRVVDPDNTDELRNAILEVVRQPSRGVPDGLEYFSYDRFGQRWGAALTSAFPDAR